MACSICGSSRRFPSEITYCVDKLFRCNDKCMERTTFEIDQTISAARRRRDEVDVSIGNPASWEATPSLSTIAAERRAALIPGWTPTTTFHDTFDVLPGAGGSLWSTSFGGTGTLTAPAAGVAAFNTVTNSGFSQAWAPSITIPKPASGKFYMLASFAVTGSKTAGMSHMVGAVVISGGVPGSSAMFVGALGPTSTAFYVAPWSLSGVIKTTATEVDSSFHYGELWWTGNGYAFAAIDLGNTGVINPRTAFTGTISPYVGVAAAPPAAATGTSYTLKLDEVVVYV